MRALLVDDEPLVLSAARMLVEWEKYEITEVFEAGNAEDALNILKKEKPEIVLSDIRMPGMSGLEFIRKINDIAPATQTILITAYGDFAYAREAVKLGCVDYLLKPLDEEDINKAVAKAVSQYRSRKMLETENSSGRTQDLLALFLENGQTEELFAPIRKTAPFFSDLSVCRAGIICTRQLAYADTGLYALANEAHDFLYRRGIGAAVIGSSGDITLLIRDPDGTNVSACAELMQKLSANGAPEVHMGLSGCEAFPDRLQNALQEARKNALSYDLLEHSIRVHRTALPAAPTLSYEETEKDFYRAVLSGKETRIRDAVLRLAALLPYEGQITLRRLENFRSIYTGLRGKWVLGFEKERASSGVSSASPAMHTRISFFPENGSFSMEYFVHCLTEDLFSLSRQYVRPREDSSGDLAAQVKRWIDSRYEEPLTLESLASRFAVSDAHLSRTFKKEYGTGPIDYIARVRIRAAKKLIAEQKLKLTEIAAAVGYPDAKYFSRVFRRITGVSPADYRADVRSSGSDSGRSREDLPGNGVLSPGKEDA